MLQNKWQYLLVVILAVLLVSEAFWYSPHFHSDEKLFLITETTKQLVGDLTNVTVKYKLTARFPMDANVVIAPVEEVPLDLPIYVFYDKRYPAVGTDWIWSAMLQAHLKAELYLRGYSREVKLADAVEVEEVLSQNESAVLIFASGAFPSNILSRQINLLKPWLNSGGILIWFGFHLGYYIVESGQEAATITDEMPQHLRENGSKQLDLQGFFEYLEMNENPTTAYYPSPTAVALDTTYDLIMQAPLLHMVLAANGLVLGKVGGETPSRLRSSISSIPAGNGRIIVFGFFLMASLTWNGPETASRDIAQILCSSVIHMNHNSTLWHRSYHLKRGEVTTDAVQLTLESEVVGISILAYSTLESEGLLFHSEFIGKNDENQQARD